MPFLTLDRCDLYYEVTGQGPALLFAHGLGGGHLSWWQQVPYFRDRYTCITFSHRGFSPSRTAPDSPGPSAFVDDLSALIDHLDLADVRLVAQSMGGWTCLGYALRHPERVRALTMACTVGSLNHPDLGAILSDNSRAAALFAQGIHPACGARMAQEQPAAHFLYREIDALSFGLDKEAMRAKLRALRTAPPEAVAALKMPLLCLTGEEDVVIPPEAVATLSRLVPGARLEQVPAAGHSVYFERPAAFNSLLDSFLQTVDR
jgi:3-oxoadipate enol-lactonase